MDETRVFLSAYTGEPFKHCVRCGETLEDMEAGYQISKYTEGSETLYEYALCHDCHGGLVASFSELSRLAMEAFHAEHMDLGRGLRHCAVCARGRHEHPHLAVTGAFRRGRLIHAILVCGPCRRHMDGLLSPGTRKVWGDFITANMDCPPGSKPVPGPLELMPI